jgi:hypothetical protein
VTEREPVGMAGSSPAHAGRLMELAAGGTAANYTRASSSGFDLGSRILKKALPAKLSRRDL